MIVELGNLFPWRHYSSKEEREKLEGALRPARASADLELDLRQDLEYPWDTEPDQRALFEFLFSERAVPLASIAFVHGRYERSYKAQDPYDDGIMGWISREKWFESGWM